MLRLSYSVVSRSVLPLALAAGLLWCAPLKAQQALTPAPAPAAASPADRQLRNDVDAYFHYAWIARYDLASQFAQKITDEVTDPAALIPILEETAKLHDPNMGYLSQILLFDNQADLKEATDKLLLKVQAGIVARAGDPELIAQMIRDMSASERAYENHLSYLRRSGEMAVPVMLQFLMLQDDQHLPYRGTARRALADLGLPAVNPLLAATAMTHNDDTLLTVIDTLGSLGYSEAVPYLALIAGDASQPEPIRNAARTSLGRLAVNPDQASDPARLFYNLALKFYYGKADIAETIDNPGQTAQTPVQTCNYWVWDADKGLERTEVPASIFNDLETLRTSEQALRLQADMPEAVALWLDADNRREVDLPAGDTDPVRGADLPAHYYNLSAGARHLKDALARALTDRDAAVSLKLTHSLGLIVGRVTLDGRIGDPLTEALRFPDKRVRFEAALALATALPAKPFANQELVVPLLVQAIGQGTGGNVLVVGDNRDDANALADTLRGLGYVTAVAGSPGEAVSAAASLPSVDAIVIGRGVSDDDLARMVSLAGQTPPLADAVELAMKATDTGVAAALALNNPLFNITSETDGDALRKAVEAARDKAGMGTIPQADADAYAMGAATALNKLVISQNAVLSVSVGETGLLAALDGSKTDLVAAVGGVIANLPSKTAQQGLARRALDDSAPAAVRLALFQSLASSAKAFGNLLDDAQVSLLQKESVDLKDTDLRSAAAEARGALNLPTDQARDLILGITPGSAD